MPPRPLRGSRPAPAMIPLFPFANETLKRQTIGRAGLLLAAAKTVIRSMDDGGGDGNAERDMHTLKDGSGAAILLLATIKDCVALDAVAVVYYLWAGSPSRRVALLQLHAALVRLLADPEQMGRMSVEAAIHHRELYGAVCGLLSALLLHGTASPNPVLRNTAQEVGPLLLRMDWLPSLSVLLSAGRAHPQLQLPDDDIIIQSVLARDLVSSMLPKKPDPGAPPLRQQQQKEAEEAQRSLLMAVAEGLVSSGVVEHWAAELVQRGSTDASSAYKQKKTRDYAAELTNLLVLLSCVLGRLGDLGAVDAPAGDASSAGGSGGGTVDGDLPSFIARATAFKRAILSGPCLQYSLAAHIVAQLVEAGDSDTAAAYGLEAGQLLLPLAGAVDGGRRELLHYSSVATQLWMKCMKLSPPVALVAYDRSIVHVLSMRMAALATRSGMELPVEGLGGAVIIPTAVKERWQQRVLPHLEQPLLAPLEARGCAIVAHISLSCASLFSRWPFIFLGIREDPAGMYCSSNETGPVPPLAASVFPVVEGPEAQSSGSAAVAAAATEFWQAAVPALHMVVGHVRAGLLDPVSQCAFVPSLLVPPFPGDPILPLTVTPNLHAALEAGYLPLLERAVRVQYDQPLEPLTHYKEWLRLSRLLAYSPSQSQAAALMASGVKLLRRLAVENPSNTANNAANIEGADLPTMAMLQWLSGFASSGSLGGNNAGIAVANRTCGGDGSGPSGSSGSGVASGSTSGASSSSSSSSSSGSGGVGGSAGTSTAADARRVTAEMGSATAPQHAAVLAPGPTRQLLLLTAFTLRLWLPAMAALAETWIQHEINSDGVRRALSGISDIAWRVVEWVPTLVHACVSVQHGVGTGSAVASPEATLLAPGTAAAGPGAPSSGAPSGTAAFWRSLLLHDMDVLHLLDMVLDRMIGMERNPLNDREALVPIRQQIDALAAALIHMAVVFPAEVAAALQDGRLQRPTFTEPCQKLPDGKATLSYSIRVRLLEVLDEVAISGVHPVPQGATPEALRDLSSWADPQSDAGFVGSLLAVAVAPAEVHGLLLRMCGNPECTNMSRDSEMELHVSACGKCRRVAYCGAGCQRAHWRAGHKAECGK